MDKSLQRLGGLIKERREAMGIYTVVEAATRSGVTGQTWSKVEAGKPAKPATYRKIEDLLNWMPGSCGSVLAGGDPHGILMTTNQGGNAKAPEAPNSPLPELDKEQLREILRRSREVTADLERLLGDPS